MERVEARAGQYSINISLLAPGNILLILISKYGIEITYTNASTAICHISVLLNNNRKCIQLQVVAILSIAMCDAFD